MKTLKIAKNLTLPLDAVTNTFAIMAKRGVGKTHTASVLAEEMLKLGQPIVAYDPTGAWWGLKSSADGKQPGFPVVIFGGEHADVPLEEAAGEMIATVIVEKRLSAILDCSLMRKGARIRFMTAFCETLYHKNREPLHLFIDEAQTVAPQNLRAQPEIARLVGALEDIILQGRRRGLGVTVISPRPAIVNTSVRSACEVLIAMQIVGPHDRKAIQDWIDLHGDDAERAKEMMASLSSLKKGEAWVWSPSWLELFTRTKFRMRETFDSSSTPTVGQRVIAPKKMASVDLEKLGQEIAATVERVKADDPKALRARITKLERELADKPAAKVVREGPVKIKTIEKPVVGKKAIVGIREAAKEMNKALRKIREIHEAWSHNLKIIDKRVADLTATIDRVANTPNTPMERPSSIVPRKAIPVPMSGQASAPTSTPSGDISLTPMDRAILTVLAQHPEGCTARKLVLLAGYTLNGSTRNSFSKLRTAGFITGSNAGVLKITLPGDAAFQDYEPLPPKGTELAHYWLHHKMMTPMDRSILTELINHPEGMAAEPLCVEAGYTLNGSTRNSFSRLRTAGLLVGRNAETMRASEELLS